MFVPVHDCRELHIFPKICDQAQDFRRQNGLHEGSSKPRTTNAVRHCAEFCRMSDLAPEIYARTTTTV